MEKLAYLMGKPAMVHLAVGWLWMALVLTIVVWASPAQTQRQVMPPT